ncbi:hypothetical protein BC939DRAFT_530755 [Gamsiella multidivaricata]|uniref:uncharacterized protein n=1 Tax=Gamsiella multidivaricata TaxID=101098 RepID=UPI00221E8741|nr:uncharacterized protein BC939DRAFT_530755 [Gamsiella multidivaricata]KAI7820119.1 hypothetical protein BC939DRAFT_530755 [Gamsiella multidivaricata]
METLDAVEDGFDDYDIQVAKAMSLSEAHATSSDKSSTRTSRKRPCLDPPSETLSNDMEEEEEPIASETLEMTEKLQKKAKLLQSQIRELRKITPPSNMFVSIKKNTRNFVETEDIKAKRRHYLQERRSDKYKDAMLVYMAESYCNQNHGSWLF